MLLPAAGKASKTSLRSVRPLTFQHPRAVLLAEPTIVAHGQRGGHARRHVLLGEPNRSPADADGDAPKDEKSLKEAIQKRVWVWSDQGNPAAPPQQVERLLGQLSGGERRRAALALALAFAEVSAARGGMQCDLLVLDEALQHLDGEGASRVARLLKRQPQGTVVLTAQAASRAMAHADLVDVVVKRGGWSRVEVAGQEEEEEEEEDELEGVAR